MAKATDITAPCALYEPQEQLRRLPRTLMGGTRAMRERRTDYLPQEEGESNAAYQVRLDRSFLYNGFARTVWSSVGKVVDRPIEVTAPPEVVKWTEDITMEGRDINLFAAEAFSTMLTEGIAFIHVEFPRSVEGATVEDEKLLRPYLIEIKPENLIWWSWDNLGGSPKMKEVRIREDYYDERGEVQPQIRVLRPGEWELYTRKGTSGEYVMVDSGPSSLGVVPIVPLYAKRKGVYQGEPPLRDLADLNLMHWQSSSDQRHILHIARVPILFAAGWGEDTDRIVLGPNRLIKSPNPGASLRFVEHSGAAIAAGAQDILDIETRMAAMGLELISTSAPGDMTATQKAIEKAETESALQIMAVELQNGLWEALDMMMKYGGVAGDLEVDVNTAFEVNKFESQEVVALFDLRMTGDLSKESLFKELIRRGLFRDDFDYEEELKIIAKEGPPPGQFGEEGEEGEAGVKPKPPKPKPAPKPVVEEPEEEEEFEEGAE